MATSTARVSFRVIVGILLILLLFYGGRPLYWKISATVHEIRQNKQTVKQGISQIVFQAQKSVGWFHDESDSGLREDRNAAAAVNRKILRQVNLIVGEVDCRQFKFVPTDDNFRKRYLG